MPVEDNLKVLYESVTGKYITSDVTLEPSWQANEYKVVFDCNGGIANSAPSIQTIISAIKTNIIYTIRKRVDIITRIN